MKKHIKTIAPSTLGVLSRLTVSGPPWVARITDGQLDRKLYVALNEALEALGGKWNRKAQGHVFDKDPREQLEQVLLTGSFTTKYAGDFFQTGEKRAAEMAAWVVKAGPRILEPSAGHGRLALAARAAGAQVECGEFFEERCQVLRSLGFPTVAGDFLGRSATPYDGVIMNPPFSGGAECRHVLHALGFVRAGGRLITIMSNGITFRETKLYEETRAHLALFDAEIVELPEGEFSQEGTNVNTVLVRVQL